jgi:26S proteasome regulatory subunit N9
MSNITVDKEAISDFLTTQSEAAPEHLQQNFLNIEDYWDKELWHELTTVLVTYFQDPESASQQLPLFRKFIVTFAEKLNQLKFVSLGLTAAQQCSGTTTFSPSRPFLTSPRRP